MDEQQHLEPFSVEGEYEDGQWINGEFYSRGRRRGRLQTKDEAIYGHQSSDDDSDGGASRRSKRSRIIGGKKSDWSKPVKFVSKQQDCRHEDSSPAKVQESSNGDEEMPDAYPTAGLGSQGAAAVAAAQRKQQNEENEGDDLLLPSAFGKRIQENAQEKRKLKKAPASEVETSRKRPEFEQHTRGVASRMMEKMGWTGGTGLGKYAQGISEPVQVHIRPKGMGMGYGQEASASEVPETSAAAPVKEHRPRPKVEQKLWLKKNRNKSREYLTADELLAKQQEKGSESVQRVLDMRGPQVRVLTDMRDLNAEEEVLEDDTPMPELQHNLRLIVNLVESDITNYDRKLRHEEQTLEYQKKEKDRLNRELARQGNLMEVMTLIMSTIASVKEGLAEGRLTLETVVSRFKKLRDVHPEDYKLCDVSVVALSFVLPLLASQFYGWEPLLQPERGLQAIQICRQMFHQQTRYDESIFPEADVSPFSRLLNEAVVPYFRRSCANWDVRYPDPMTTLLDKWQDVLSPSVLQNFLEQCIMPKLRTEVNAWNPVVDTVAIHTWIHPWLPFLGSRMEPLYVPIRFRLEQALQKWQAWDSSAHIILRPWKKVFDAASWEQLLVRSILPKLMQALDAKLVVNPHNQAMNPFEWVRRWFEDVPLHHMVALLETGFFPKWQHALYAWLSAGNPDLEQVSGWFTGWKELFSPELLANDRVRWQLNGALNMMEQAVEGRQVVHPGARGGFEDVAPMQQPPAPEAIFVDDEREISLKEAVEMFAQENDVKFLPKPERVHEGLQVYGFGAVSVAIDSFKQEVLAQSGDRWSVVSLAQLLDMHREKASSGISGSRWR